MSEVPKPPEEVKNQLKFSCYGCKERCLTDRTNTFAFYFTKTPWFNHTKSKCNEGHVSILMPAQLSCAWGDFADQFLGVTMEFCDDKNLQKVAREILKIDELNSRELTEEEDMHLRKWGRFLETITVDMTDFIYGI